MTLLHISRLASPTIKGDRNEKSRLPHRDRCPHDPRVLAGSEERRNRYGRRRRCRSAGCHGNRAGGMPSADPRVPPGVVAKRGDLRGQRAAVHARGHASPRCSRTCPGSTALGVDILWLMPVQPIGVKNRKGKLGSYYAISDYTAINPEFGTEADFKAFVDAAHAQGMKVILDWVANHTAHDHEWVTAHPDYHEREADGSLIERARQRGKRDRLDRRRRARTTATPSMRAGDDRRDAVVGRPHGDRRLPLRRRRRRADGLLGRGAHGAQGGRVPICSCSPRPRIRGCTRRST